MANIFIFGDSITYGCWDEDGGWANRVKNEIDCTVISSQFAQDHFVYPLGIPGDTTHTLLQRFKLETDARVVPTEQTIFLFAIGINDSIFNNRTNSHMIPLWKFKNNIKELVQAANRYSGTILFIGLTPVDETKVDPMSWLPESSYRNEYIKEYDNAIREVCAETEILFVDIFPKWMESDYRALLQDGVHPNSQGHDLIFSAVKSELQEFLL